MKNNFVIFVIKKLYFVDFLDFICTWVFNFLICWTVVGLERLGQELLTNEQRKTLQLL